MRVGVVGTTGYTAAELIRWLILHPEVESLRLSSSRPGVALSSFIRDFGGLTRTLSRVLWPNSMRSYSAASRAAKGLVTELDAAGCDFGLPVITVMPKGGLMDGRVGDIKLQRNGSQFLCFATAISMACAPLKASGRSVTCSDGVLLLGSD